MYTDNWIFSGKNKRDQLEGKFTMKYKNGKVEIGYFKNAIPMDKCSMKMMDMISEIYNQIGREL